MLVFVCTLSALDALTRCTLIIIRVYLYAIKIYLIPRIIIHGVCMYFICVKCSHTLYTENNLSLFIGIKMYLIFRVVMHFIMPVIAHILFVC